MIDMADETYAVAVDLGGSKICVGLVSESSRLLIGEPSTSEISDDLDVILHQLDEAIGAFYVHRDAGQISGIGLGAPGPLCTTKGALVSPPNLRSLHDFPLVDHISEKFGAVVRLESDGNLFALGEANYGCGFGSEIVVGVTLGTGFGNGIVLGNQIYRGATGNAGETYCSPYKSATIDDYVSARSLLKRYGKLTGTLANSPRELASLAHRGDMNAKIAWSEWGEHVGQAAAHLANVLDPHVIVFGGSLSKQWELFSDALSKTLRDGLNCRTRSNINVRKSSLFEKANLLGAADLVFSLDGTSDAP